MDIVRGSRTLKVSKRGDTLTTMLTPNKPLVAKYQNGQVVGSWVTDNRTVYVQVLSSFTNTPIDETKISAITWRFNGQPILDNDKRFKKGTYNIGSVKVPSIVIMDDIMRDIETSTSLEFEANVYSGGYTTKVSNMITVTRETVSANTYTAYIMDANGRGATITTDYKTVTLKAILERGGIETTENITWQWFKMTLDESEDLGNDKDKDGKMTLVGETKQTIVIKADDVSTYDTFGCDYFENGKKIKSALISVRDETDPLEIQYNKTGGDESDFTETMIIEYKPKVVYRGTTDIAVGNWTWKYQKTDSEGNLVGTVGTGDSYKVIYPDFTTKDKILTVLFEARDT